MDNNNYKVEEGAIYALDYVYNDMITKGQKIPALTRKNADFIEGVVKIDSNYGRDLDVESKYDAKIVNIKDYLEKYLKNVNQKDEEVSDSEIETKTKKSNNKAKYCGSIAYWFNQMNNGQYDFETCLSGAIIAIDRTNSTHLNSSINGRLVIKDRILNDLNINDVKGLKNHLKLKNNDLISKLTDEMDGVRKNTKRYNLSFASKFCAYAAQFLLNEFLYSKYDNIVSTNLPIYEKLYLGKLDVKNNTYLINQNHKKKYSTLLEFYLSIYENYCKTINEILEEVNSQYDKKEDKLTLDEFDHIIWYGLKGK